jgi:hypothetical protein
VVLASKLFVNNFLILSHSRNLVRIRTQISSHVATEPDAEPTLGLELVHADHRSARLQPARPSSQSKLLAGPLRVSGLATAARVAHIVHVADHPDRNQLARETG